MIIGFFIITFIGLTNADPMPLNYKFISFIDDKNDVKPFVMLDFCGQTISGDYSKYSYFNETHSIRTYYNDMNCKNIIQKEKYYETEYFNDDMFIYDYEICTKMYKDNDCKTEPYHFTCFTKEGCNKYIEGDHYFVKYFSMNKSISYGEWREPECQPYSPYNYINGKCYSGVIIEYFGKNNTFPIFIVLFIIIIHFLL